jgi:polar amino acid transport system substrate-binding protein
MARVGLGWLTRIVLAASALLVALLSSPPLIAAELDGVFGKPGELSWGGDLQGGAPYVFEDEKEPGKIRGFEVDIADALARRLGVTARFAQNDWSNLVPALERGDFDIALNGLEDTAERRARILLSAPYFVYGETLAVRKGESATSLEALRGKRVATLNQTFAHDFLKTRGVEIVLYEGQQEPYADLVQGRVSAVLLDHIIADVYGCPLPEVRCVSEDVVRGTYVIGIAKGRDALKRAVDDALAAMRRDGELERILRAWKLWDARQETLAPSAATTPGASAAAPVASAGPASVPPSAPAPARSFDRVQLALFLKGAAATIAISLGAFALALPLGLLLAISRAFGGAALRVVATAYIELFRGTPVLLQLYVLYFGLAPIVKFDAWEAAVLGLGLNYAAYEAEVHRGALMALPRGQSEAARALGLTRLQTLRHVLVPQAFTNALPAVTNDFIALLKDSSLVSVITVVELTKRMTISAVDLRDWLVPGVACAALYLAMSLPLARLSRHLERRLAHDSHPRLA